MLGDCASIATRVATDSRSDPTSSRCQITRIRVNLLVCDGCERRFSANEPEPDWWSQTGSNRRPPACKAGALPTELWPRRAHDVQLKAKEMVGLGRLELPTSRLSSARSNQLSYKPLTRGAAMARSRLTQLHRTSAKPLARVRPRRKRNEDGEIPPMQLNDPDDRWPLMFLKRSDR